MRSKQAHVAALVGCLLPLLGILSGKVAVAAPYVPASDEEVLITLPRRLAPRQAMGLVALKRYHEASPNDPEVASQLAETYLALGRLDADPRQFGMAEAVLAPWTNEKRPPRPVLRLRAEINGYNHAFDAALADFNTLLDGEALTSEDAGTLLARSVLLAVIGRLTDADKDCGRLAKANVEQEATLCRMNLAVARGHGEGALLEFKALEAKSPGRVAWATEVAAEAAAQAGDSATADRLFKRSLKEAPGDVFKVCAYADFLLKEGRSSDVVTLIPADATNVGVMVRKAMALTRSKPRDPKALRDLIARLDEGFELETQRGSRVHARELALHLLAVKGDKAAALKAAKANWATQKEPIDAALLAGAALAAKDAPTASQLHQQLVEAGIAAAALTRYAFATGGEK